MRAIGTTLALLLIVTSFLQGQAKIPTPQKAARSEAKIGNEDPSRELALRLLEEANADAGVLDAAERAGLQYLAGQAYATVDRSKANELFQSSYENARVAFDERPKAIAFILPDIAAATARVAPDMVEQSLPPEESSRDVALGVLIEHHLERKDVTHCIELLQTMHSEYGMARAAVNLLLVLPKTRQDERDRVFATVLRNYKSAKHYQIGTGHPEDLGSLVVRFHTSISRPLIREAVDELLAQAKSIHVHLVMSTSERTADFNAYQFRLFQLLPAIREIDPLEADALLKENAEISALLKVYPDGQRSVDRWLRDTPMKGGERQQTAYMLADDKSNYLSARIPRIDRAIEAYGRDATGDPYSAITKAAGMQDGAARTKLLIEIARNCQKEDPKAARAALRQLRSTPPDDPNMYNRVKIAADIAQELGDKDLVNALIDLGLKEARSLYEFESEKDDTNWALKVNWVSTRAYREFLGMQVAVAPDSALQNLKELPDTEIRALTRVAMAASLLKTPIMDTSPVGKTPKSAAEN